MHKMNLYYVTMTNYDDTFNNIYRVFDKDNITETLGEVLEKNNKKQIRIAETEKYPHVTFFFVQRPDEAIEQPTHADFAERLADPMLNHHQVQIDILDNPAAFECHIGDHRQPFGG